MAGDTLSSSDEDYNNFQDETGTLNRGTLKNERNENGHSTFDRKSRASRVSRASSIKGNFKARYPVNYEPSIEETRIDQLKYILAGFSLILFILSIFLIYVYYFTDLVRHDYSSLVGFVSEPISEPYLLVALWLVTFTTIVLTLVSFIGTYREASLFLRISLGILIFILAIDLYGIISGFIFNSQSNLESFIKNNLNTAFNKNYRDDLSSLTAIIDRLQQTEKCCGIQNYESWADSNWFEVHSSLMIDPERRNLVPDSCCIEEKLYCGRNVDKYNIFRETYSGGEQGCLGKVMQIMTQTYYYKIRLILVMSVVHFIMLFPLGYLDYLIQGFDYENV